MDTAKMMKAERKVNIPIFIPHLGCPNMCVFCNQRTISGHSDFDINTVKNEIDTALSTIDMSNTEVQIAFFGGSFTGIDYDLMCRLLEIANEYIKNGAVDSIRCSTRPDYIDEKILSTLKGYGVKVIELGIQSISDKVLLASKRGHTFETAENACRLIKEYGFELVGQMMIGLLEADIEDELQTAQFIIKAGADAARIYPTVVFNDTELRTMAEIGKYIPLSVDEAVERSAQVLDMFVNADIPVIRIGLCASENLSSEQTFFAGPNHSALGELVFSRLYFNRIIEKIKSLKKETNNKILYIEIPLGETSKAVGQHRKNKELLTAQYGFSKIICKETDRKKYSVDIYITD